jgi:hypothetical protein
MAIVFQQYKIFRYISLLYFLILQSCQEHQNRKGSKEKKLLISNDKSHTPTRKATPLVLLPMQATWKISLRNNLKQLAAAQE